MVSLTLDTGQSPWNRWI